MKYSIQSAIVCTAIAIIASSPGLFAAAPQDNVVHEGFARPVEQVDLAAADSGVLAEIATAEGAMVRAGQLICRFDTSVLDASLAAAQVRFRSRGELAAAQATLRHRRNHLEQLISLREKSHASDQEVIDAELAVAIAEAGKQSAEDKLNVVGQEVTQIQAQIDRHWIVAPFDGVVLELPHAVGERVNAADGYVAKLARLDQLRVRYDVPTSDAVRLRAGDRIAVQFQETNQDAQATVEFISPVTDSGSGTVRIEVLVDNRSGEFRSGMRCMLTDSFGHIAQRRGVQLR
ncbi:Cobalt-zinc-cadmium resistance protein CzcB [Rubripirellula tenax]|uniref:Cobalt-zinc-cadmium resistance protein CzcB n=1 Tax=Rubripirellula tenax TaxID=2528015 RepID=A0A5C6FGK9_9BACT|nr:efflux RND transporter periplasmic adaptor subunit [Rubripirellula tenax]TWU59985.1 Cobalt-zinc-cadmium resistance protein CzcB [Rubripirellula tenax]